MIDDYFIALIPAGIDINDVATYAELKEQMMRQADAYAMAQYGRRKPKLLLFQPTEWLVTGDPDEVERFQPDHDCDECRAGNRAARDFLLANPGRFVACGNLHYTEVWK